MASILCRRGGSVHYHPTSSAVRACHGTPQTATVRPYEQHVPTVRNPDAHPTSNQLSYIASLADERAREFAAQLNRSQASSFIDYLKGQPVTQPAPVQQAAPPRTRPSIVPLQLLAHVPDGRYAVRPDSETPYTFIRLTRPKKGRYGGCTKVQTQHSDTLKEAFVVWPSGQASVYRSGIEASLLLLVTNHHQAAIEYGRELGACCRCGKSLTDEESRHYGIGPECITVWPHIKALVDEQNGEG